MDKRKNRVFSRISAFRRLKQLLKGSCKDPFLYLGVVSAVLFYLVPLAYGFSSSLNGKKEAISMAALSQGAQESAKQDESLNAQESFLPESPELLLVGKSSFKPAPPPVTVSPQILGAMSGDSENADKRTVITEYIVAAGDSLASIAADFDISLNTLLWANDLIKSSRIKAGQTLVIPPVSGVVYHVKSGDTLSDIAKKYKGDTDAIVAFNNLASEKDIYVGDVLMIPDGVMPAVVKPNIVPVLPLPNSYFICPIASPCRITQGLHFYNAVDFSNGKCGDPVYAAAAGEVVKMKLTESTSKSAFGGAGNNISILHQNGAVTTYYHLLSSLVQLGDKVSQGQTIALVGGQPGTPGAGKTTGCHLHFGVVGASNPFVR